MQNNYIKKEQTFYVSMNSLAIATLTPSSRTAYTVHVVNIHLGTHHHKNIKFVPVQDSSC